MSEKITPTRRYHWRAAFVLESSTVRIRVHLLSMLDPCVHQGF